MENDEKLVFQAASFLCNPMENILPVVFQVMGECGILGASQCNLVSKNFPIYLLFRCMSVQEFPTNIMLPKEAVFSILYIKVSCFLTHSKDTSTPVSFVCSTIQLSIPVRVFCVRHSKLPILQNHRFLWNQDNYNCGTFHNTHFCRDCTFYRGVKGRFRRVSPLIWETRLVLL